MEGIWFTLESLRITSHRSSGKLGDGSLLRWVLDEDAAVRHPDNSFVPCDGVTSRVWRPSFESEATDGGFRESGHGSPISSAYLELGRDIAMSLSAI